MIILVIARCSAGTRIFKVLSPTVTLPIIENWLRLLSALKGWDFGVNSVECECGAITTEI